MAVYKDQLGREIILDKYPRRIVSLVPSITELLFDLGLEKEVVGITKFCVHPQAWFKTKARIGGTKKINANAVLLLKPELIIANKEENAKEQIELLEDVAPVWVTDVGNLQDALSMINGLGAITNRMAEASLIIGKIKPGFEKLHTSRKEAGLDGPGRNEGKVRTCYLIWKDPYMSVGHDTFIHDMLQHCGFENIFARHTRYPEVSVSDIKAASCDVLLLSSEPYPFRQKHIEELQIQLPGCYIHLVDGEMFSWYGSRLIYAATYFEKIRNEIRFPKQKA